MPYLPIWDTRPWADNTPMNKTTILYLGAKRWCKRVGVLLEIARLLGQQQPELGVDIIFFDAEDYGVLNFTMANTKKNIGVLAHSIGRGTHVQGLQC